MLEFLSEEAHAAFVLVFLIWCYVWWIRYQANRRLEFTEMTDWCIALKYCIETDTFYCFPKGVREEGIYRRLKLMEKYGIDADVHYDKETLYVRKKDGTNWACEVY